MLDATLLNWLKMTFEAAVDVRLARIEPDESLVFQPHVADVVVETWMGARLYVYCLQEPPKVRDLRATLRENTRHGIGTLFIAMDKLLPAHDDTVKPSDWQTALFLLQDNWIYSVGVDARGACFLRQVHFTPTAQADEYRCWHLNDFKIETVVVRQRELLETALKGRWAMGDIASPSYKRRINYERTTQRFHYSTKQTHPASSRPPSDRLLDYYHMLGLGDKPSEREVKAAFRRMALQVHPDVSALPRSEAERRIKELNEAYEYIKDYHGWG